MFTCLMCERFFLSMKPRHGRLLQAITPLRNSPFFGKIPGDHRFHEKNRLPTRVRLENLIVSPSDPPNLLRAKPTVLMTSYHTRDSVEEEKNRCPIGQSFIYKSTFCGVHSQITTLLRAKPTVLMTSYHTRDSVEEEKNRCPIGQSFIYKSTFCGVRSQITTPIIPPDNISFILQAQPVTTT